MTKRLIVVACMGMASCYASEDDRRSTFDAAARVNYAVARGAVVRDMRSPQDSSRIIYNPPTHLSRAPAGEAGAREVWAPFGIATPDTIARKNTP